MATDPIKEYLQWEEVFCSAVSWYECANGAPPDLTMINDWLIKDIDDLRALDELYKDKAADRRARDLEEII